MTNTQKLTSLTTFTAMFVWIALLGLSQALSHDDSLENLIKKIPTKIEHGESGSAHYKLSSLKMNGVKHATNNDPPNMWPPRPGRRSFIPDQWYKPEQGAPRPGRRALEDQDATVRKPRPRPGRAFIPQKPYNPFMKSTRPGRNAEGDIPWEYTGNSLKTGQSKESHTLKQIAPQTKREYQEEKLEFQKEIRH